MLSIQLRKISEEQMETLLKKCGIPTSVDDIKKEFNVTVECVKNYKGQFLATVNTRTHDALWWKENKNTNASFWRESDFHLYNYTDYSDSELRSIYIATLRAIKPYTCLILLNEMRNKTLA
jgi:hypothetical protein